MGKVDPGKHEWLQSVLDRYEAPLVRYATRLTGDLESARDVVQDTFLRLIVADRSKVEDHAAEWLFTVCRRRVIDVKGRQMRVDKLHKSIAEACESSNVDPAAIVESRQAGNRVLDLVSALPEKQQEVVRLKFQNAMSYQQIASITGLSASNVGFILHKAIKSIREQLQDGGASS